MSVYIAVINKNNKNKIKLLNGKLVIENEVMENEIQNEIKVNKILVCLFTLRSSTQNKNR